MAQYENIGVTRIQMVLAGVTSHYKFVWVNDDVGIASDGFNLNNAVIAQVLPELQSIMSNDTTMTFCASTLWRGMNGTPVMTVGEANISLAGTIASDPLPPAWTVNVYKFPDNTAGLPDGLSTFLRGGMRISGVPENAVSDGLLEASYRTIVNNAFTTLQTISVADGVGSVAFLSAMAKSLPNPSPNHQYLAPIDSYECGRVGTQRTRLQ